MAMKKTAPLILVVAVVAAIAIGTVLVRKSATTADAPVEPAAIEEVAPRPASGQPVASRPPRQSMAQARDRIHETAERRNQAREEQARKTAELNRQAAETFRNEQVDPAWAPQKETELTDIAAIPAFETAGAVPTSMDIECKSSMCRLESSFENSGQAEDWILLYMSSVGGAMPNSLVSRTANPDGSTRVEIYGRAR